MSAPPPPVFATSGDPTQVMGRRFGAYAIDVALSSVIGAIVFLTNHETIPPETVSSLGISCTDEGSPGLCVALGDEIWFAEGGKATLFWLVTIGSWFANRILVQGATGGTVGKLAVGIRVIRQESGQLAGFGRCAARALMGVVDAFPYVFPLVGLITAVVSKGHRRVGDMVARTLVVATADVGRAPQVAGVTTGAWTPPPPVSAPQVPTESIGQVFVRPDMPPPENAQTTVPVADQPVWDPNRNAYVLWDSAQQRWLVHDTASGQWVPI